MKHTKRILAAILALVLLLTPMVSASAANTDDQTDTIVYFDLEAFLLELPTSQIQYDYFKLATALQGLANREKPQLFFHMIDNGVADGLGYDMDSYWFDKITDPKLGYGELAAGGDLANYKVVKAKSIWTLLDRFSDCYNGIVLWDEDVPSTSNVASTIAGCENLLPVRYATGGYDLYTTLMSKGFKKDDIKRDLTGLFSGEGYIPTLGSSVPGAKIEYTTTPSTKSQKTDPYIWAKMFYLDTGLTHPLHMTYSIDARTNRKSDWNKQDGETEVKAALAGELVSANIPSVMGLGEVRAFSLTYQNTGTENWSEATYDRFAINYIDGPFRLANKDDGSNSDSGDGNRIKLGADVQPGENYTVTGWLVAPRTPGEYTFHMFMNREGHGNISPNHTVKITVEAGGEKSAESSYVPYTPFEIVEQESPAKNAAIIKAGVGASVEPNASGTAQVVVKNTGTEAWPAGSTYALQYKVGTAAAATISLPTAVDPGQNVSFNVPYTAPASGALEIALQMVSGGENVGAGYTCSADVVGSTSATALAAEIVSVSSPKSLTAGAKAEIVVEVLNSGSSAWTNAVKLVDVSSKGYMSGEGVDDDDAALVSEIALEPGVTVEAGETYRFHFDLHTYTNNGTKKVYLEPKQLAGIELQVNSGSTAISDSKELSYEIIDVCDTPVTVFAKTSDYALTNYEYNARFISAAMPTTMNVGELVPVQFTLMNIGTATWESIKAGRSYLRMAFRGAQNGFGFVTDPATGTGDVRDLNRIDITNGVAVAPGDTYTYTAYLKAPAEAGIYDVRLDGLRDVPTAWATADKTFTVTVVDPANPSVMSVVDESEELTLTLEPELEVKAVGAITADIPASSEPYTDLSVAVTAKNTTSSAWTVPAGVTDVVVGDKVVGSTVTAKLPTVAGVYLKYSYANPFNPIATNKSNPFVYYAPLKAATAANATAEFTAKLTTPVVEGTYDLKMQVVSVSGSTETVLVSEVTEQYASATATPAATAAGTTAAANKSTTYKMEYVDAKIPATMSKGESAFISISYKNTGAAMAIMSTANPTQGNRASIGLCAQSGAGGFKLLDYGFTFASGGEKHDSWALAHTKENQLHLREGQPERNFDANETEVFTGVLTAPETPGTYTLSFAGFSGTETYASDMTNFTVKVVDPADKPIVTGMSKTAEPYEKQTLTVKAKNDTTAAWTVPSGVTAPVQGYTVSYGTGNFSYVKPTVAGVYLKYTYKNPYNPTATNRLNPFVYYAPLSAATAIGAEGKFSVSLNVPVVEGEYELKTQVVSISGTTETVLVNEVVDKFEVKTATPKATVAGTTASAGKSTTYKTEFVEAKIPATMKAGESAFISITYKNLAADMAIMNASFGENRATVGLVAQSGAGGFKLTDYGLGLAETGEREQSWAKTHATLKNQLNLREGQPERNFPKNQSRTFTGLLTAPATAGTYTLSFAGLSGAATPTSDMTNFTIVVEGDNAGGEGGEGGETETPSATKEVVFHESANVTTEDYKATIMSAVLPETVKPGEKIAVSFTVKNTGTQTLKSKHNVGNAPETLRLAFLGSATQFNSANKPSLQPTSILDANGRMKDKFFILCDSTTTKANESPWAGAANSEYTRMDIKSNQTIASGAAYTYTGYFVAPTNVGTYTIQVVAMTEGTFRSAQETIKIKVVDPNAEPVVENNVIFHETVNVTTEQYKAAIMGASVPLQVDPGEKFDVSFTVKNIGTATLKSKHNVGNAAESLRLAFLGSATQFNSANKPSLQPTSILDANGRMQDKFFILCSSTTTKANESPWEGAANSEYTRMDIKSNQTIASGASYTYTGSFVAPTKEGKYEIKIVALADGQSPWRSSTEKIVITVGEPDSYKPTEPTYTTLARDADILLATLPEVYANESGEMKFVVKNTGTETWAKTTEGEAGYYLRLTIGSEKIYIPASKDIASGETAQFVCDYTAPDRETTRTVTAQMVYRNANATSKFFGEKVTDEIIIKLDTGVRAAQILSVQYSESLRESTKGTLMVEVLNTGAITWGGNNKIVLSELDGKAYLSAPGTADDDATSNTISIEPGVKVAPGERYVFVADMHTWTMYNSQRDYVMPNTKLELTLQLDAISGDSTGKFGDEIATSTKITTVEVKPDVVIDEDPDDYSVTNETQKAVLVYAEMPTKMAPGQLMPVKLTFKNIGQTEWYATNPMTTINCVRLRCDTNGPFDMCKDFAGTDGWTSNRDRVNLADWTKNDHVMPGETYTYEFYLKAPTNPGSYTFIAYLINDGVSGQGGFEEKTYSVSFPIQVGTTSASDEVEVATSKATYDNLMFTAVGNADYYIMHKAFFWDLAMDETIAPLDDRSQPVGTDVKVLRQLLDSQRKRAQAYEEGKDPWNKVPGVGEGYGIFQVGGFLPWYSKYCKESDPQSKFNAAQQEWQQMMHISEYGGGSDADAYGTVTISNCSVYSKLKNNVPKFSKNVTQAQPDFDPAVGDPTVKYDPEKTYILWHMGDWDGSSWTATIMPMLMENDPRRGEIPVGWAVAAGNSLRIPQLFNWLYDNATPNDYFIAGDNGINYYDPNMNSRPHTEVTGITKEMGLEILDDFVAYNQYFNDIFSMDICGLLHTAGSGPSDDVVREAMSQMFPYGVGVTQEGANTKQEDCGIFVGADGKETPFIPSYVFTTTSNGILKSAVKDLGANLASKIKYGPQFQVLRTVKVKVTSLIEIMEAMEAANPGIDQIYEVVDPYTFMRLAREADGGFTSRGATTYNVSRAGAVKIDGTMAQGEWTAAKQMHVSPTSAEVAKSGRNWNTTTLATEADLNTKFSVMWDNNYLYVAENRSDDGHISTAKTNGIDWTADAGAVYISTDGSNVGSTYNEGDNAVIFNVGADGLPNVWIRQGGEGGNKVERKLGAGEYIAACKLGSGGNYVFEIAIPWSVLGDFRPAYGKTVGLTVLAIDGDDGLVGGARQIMWAGAGDDQGTWAVATLK